MRDVKKLLFSLGLLSAITLFSFVPTSYASDPCDTITDPPLLYQIDRSPTKATLYFTPVGNDQVQNYTIIYGLKAEEERYSIIVPYGVSTGAITYTINDLLPGVQYFYKVNGNTACTSSPWSNWVGDKGVTKGTEKVIPSSALPVTGSETAVTAAVSLFAL